MDKVKFNPFSEILDKDFNQQAEYVGDAVSMFIKDFLTEDKAVVLGLNVKAQAVADMTVYVAPGRLYQVGKQGQLTVNSNPPLAITAAHPDYDRIDRVCARYAEIDDEPETRNVMVDTVSRQVVQKTVMTRISGTVEFLVVSGVAAPVPAAPTVPDGWVSLAKVNVKQNASEVLQADIIDERPTVSAYLQHKHTGSGDGAKIDYSDVRGTPDLDAINAKTATRLKPALNGSRNQCWLLCKLPKTALALVHYRILGAQYYDQYSVLEVVIKNGRGWCKYTGFSTNYQVVVRAYETENSIDVYLFAQGYDDIWEVFLEKNNAVSEFAYKKVGDATYVPAGTLVCDTATGQGMSGVELFNAKSSTGESIGHIGFTISNIPDGCLILDTGAVVSRATYPELWKFVQSNKNLLPVVTDAEWQTMAGNQTAVVAFSMGDGSTTFRLPRLLGWAKGGAQADVGNTHEAGLPNITGSISPLVFGKMYDGQKKGAFAYENNHFNMSQGTAGVSFGQQNISFNASKSNTIYGASNEVQPAGFVGVYYIRAFHGTTNEGLADVTALANEKADRDLSNISAAGKSSVSGLGMPSNTFVTITNNFVNNNMSYTAPANGWLCFFGNVTGINAAVQIVNNNTTWRIRDVGQGSTFSPEVQCPMKKGDIATLTYEGTIGVKGIAAKFIYAEGEI